MFILVATPTPPNASLVKKSYKVGEYFNTSSLRFSIYLVPARICHLTPLAPYILTSLASLPICRLLMSFSISMSSVRSLFCHFIRLLSANTFGSNLALVGEGKDKQTSLLRRKDTRYSEWHLLPNPCFASLIEETRTNICCVKEHLIAGDMQLGIKKLHYKRNKYRNL